MKKYTLNKSWNLNEISRIRITNEMAPLTISSAPANELFLEALISTETEVDLNLEELVLAERNGNELKLELMELPFSKLKHKKSMLMIVVPEELYIKVDTENMPLSIYGLENDLDIESENAPVSIKSCTGKLKLEGENGPLSLMRHIGNIDLTVENGPVVAEDISGDKLKVESENAPLRFRLAEYKQVDIESENGPISYETLPVEGGDYSFASENGMIHLILPLSFTFSLTAKSESGRLKSKLEDSIAHEDGVFKIERLQDSLKPTRIRIETENGLIRLNSDGRIDLDFLKNMLENVKDSLAKVESQIDAEKMRDLVNKLSGTLRSVSTYIRDEKTKARILENIEKIKSSIQDYDFKEKTGNVQSKVEELGSEIYENLKEGLRNVKAEFDGLRYEHLNTDALKDYVQKVVNSPYIKPYLGAAKKHIENEEIAERSRLKILEMLEAGKISSEEAERLLKAISKE